MNKNTFRKYACVFDIVDDSYLTASDKQNVDRYAWNFISWPPNYFVDNSTAVLGISEACRNYLAEVQRLGTLLRTGNDDEERHHVVERLEHVGRILCFNEIMSELLFYEDYEEFISYMRSHGLHDEADQLSEEAFLDLHNQEQGEK